MFARAPCPQKRWRLCCRSTSVLGHSWKCRKKEELRDKDRKKSKRTIREMINSSNKQKKDKKEKDGI
jgi:hypothetical protein